MQLFSGSLVECENAKEFVRNGGVIYDGLININRTTNGCYSSNETLNLLRIRWSYRTRKTSSTKISRKNIGGGEILRLSGLQRRTDYDALIDGLVKNMDD
jgi:hypothetical protein